MRKSSTIAVCVLVLSGSVAFAQTYPSTQGQAPATGGATGTAPMNSVGSPTANSQGTASGGTQSTTVLSQSNKAQSAVGAPSSNYGQQGAQPGGMAYGQTQTMSNTGTQDYGAQGPGMQNQAQMSGSGQDDPRAVALTDEYGNQYNGRGERIGRGRPIAKQMRSRRSGPRAVTRRFGARGLRVRGAAISSQRRVVAHPRGTGWRCEHPVWG
jgi:hypothetical protein